MSTPWVVGVPRELKDGEHRVAITPDGVHELARARRARAGRAGRGRGLVDHATTTTAAPAPRSSPTRPTVWARADLVFKVKEPQPEEFPLLRPGLVLFTYLHLAAYPEVADALLDARGRRRSPTRRCSSRSARCRCSRR